MKKSKDFQSPILSIFSQEAIAFDIIEMVLMVFLTSAGCRRMSEDAVGCRMPQIQPRHLMPHSSSCSVAFGVQTSTSPDHSGSPDLSGQYAPNPKCQLSCPKQVFTCFIVCLPCAYRVFSVFTFILPEAKENMIMAMGFLDDHCYTARRLDIVFCSL